MTSLTRIDLLTLAVLAEGEEYGYSLAQQIDARTGGAVQVRPGNLYRVIDRLVERGYAEPADRKAVDEDGDERRQYYRITREGRKVAAEELALYARVLDESQGLASA